MAALPRSVRRSRRGCSLMSPIVTSIEVDRPAAEVFAYATDPSRFSEWQQGVVSGHMDGGSTPALGDRCVTTRRIGRAERASTAELVGFDPPRHWSVRGIDGPIRAMVDVSVEERSAAHTQLTISLDFEGHGIGRLLVPLLVRREARKEMPASVKALKQASRDRLRCERAAQSFVLGVGGEEALHGRAVGVFSGRNRGLRHSLDALERLVQALAQHSAPG